MDSNFISYDEDEQAAFASGFARIATAFDSLCSSVPGKFSAATDVGLLTSIGNITNEMAGIGGSAGAIGNSSQKNASAMFDYDMTMAKKLDSELLPPQDYIAENTMEVNQYNNTLVGKMDGRSVNEGEAAKQASEIDDSIVEAQGLSNMLGEEAHEEIYDDSSRVNKSVLGSINNGQETEETAYDDKLSVGKTNLASIAGDGGLEQQQLTGESTIHGESVLGNINKGTQAEMTNYTDAYSAAAAQQLGSIAKEGADSSELDQVAMKAAFDNFVANEYSVQDKKEEELKKKIDEEAVEHVDYNEFENTHNV